MTDSFLLNDGSSFILLNDGSTILMNEHEPGVKIHGLQATQQQKTTRGRKQQLIPIEFSFQIIARTIPRVVIQLVAIGKILSPKGNYTENLRDSFRLQITDMKTSLVKLSKYNYMESVVEYFVDNHLEDYVVAKKLFKSIKGGFKKWNRQSKK